MYARKIKLECVVFNYRVRKWWRVVIGTTVVEKSLLRWLGRSKLV
jgi:hypothetical protein